MLNGLTRRHIQHSTFSIQHSTFRFYGAAGGVVVHPFASHAASKSTPYRPSEYICTMIQFWLGRRVEYGFTSRFDAPLSSEIHSQPPKSPEAIGGSELALVGMSAEAGVDESRAMAMAFSCSSKRTTVAFDSGSFAFAAYSHSPFWEFVSASRHIT